MSNTNHVADWASLLKIEDVARILGCSSRTIANWIKAGHLQPIRIGRTLRFHPADIRALVCFRLQQRLGSKQNIKEFVDAFYSNEAMTGAHNSLNRNTNEDDSEYDSENTRRQSAWDWNIV